MAKLKPADIKKLVNKRFDEKKTVLTLWQSLAENFYPERADFTLKRNVGYEISDNLLASAPIMMRRDLGNAFGSMLRDGSNWFNMTVEDIDKPGKEWMQWATKRQSKTMYKRESRFVRSAKEGDHDYAAFGQYVMSIQPNRNYNGILYNTWHLRDCAWWDGEDGEVCGVARDWNPQLNQILQYFNEKNLHPNMLKNKQDGMLTEHKIYHTFFPNEEYGEDNPKKYVSVFLDVVNEHIIEETFTDRKMYIVPRFQHMTGAAYAISPAAMIALPDARMLQAMTHTLMEAGERHARPPLMATIKAVTSSVDLNPDGLTWIKDDYDQKTGRALEPLYQDRGGFPIGLELRDSILETLSDAFYLSKLNLPEVSREMTAYEVSERMKQYRREVLPLFAPMEHEANAQICERTFDLMMDMGMFGSAYDIPESLRGKDVEFKFESPLSIAEEEKKITQFQQIGEILAQATQFDQSAPLNIDIDEALREAVQATGAPEKWLASIEEVVQSRAMAQQEAAEMQAAG